MIETIKIDYDFGAKTGRLYMIAGMCCDMTHCIKVFSAIDPSVSVIYTFSGWVPDTVYRLSDNGWTAYAR